MTSDDFIPTLSGLRCMHFPNDLPSVPPVFLGTEMRTGDGILQVILQVKVSWGMVRVCKVDGPII